MTNRNGIILSMRGKGNCYDNAVAKKFFHALKAEHVYQNRFDAREEAKSSLFELANKSI